MIFCNICIYYSYHDALLLKVSNDIIWSVIVDNVFSLKRLTSPAYDQQTTQENVFSLKRHTSPAYNQQIIQESSIENIAWIVTGAIVGVFLLILISLRLYISNRKGKPVYSLWFYSRLFNSRFWGSLQQIHFFK